MRAPSVVIGHRQSRGYGTVLCPEQHLASTDTSHALRGQWLQSHNAYRSREGATLREGMCTAPSSRGAGASEEEEGGRSSGGEPENGRVGRRACEDGTHNRNRGEKRRDSIRRMHLEGVMLCEGSPSRKAYKRCIRARRKSERGRAKGEERTRKRTRKSERGRARTKDPRWYRLGRRLQYVQGGRGKVSDSRTPNLAL